MLKNLESCIQAFDISLESEDDILPDFDKWDDVVSTRKKVATGQKRKRGASVPCRCIETGETFPSFRQAGIAFGVSAVAIADCCDGIRISAAGHHFERTRE